MGSIGLDVGHSAVKVAFSDTKGALGYLTIPTAICQAFRISDEAEAARAAKETVRVGNANYFIGETALVQGGGSVTSGLSEDWIGTPEYSALMLGAYKRALGLMGERSARLVMGLPTHLFSRQKVALRNTAISLLGATDIRIIPQPMGPYFEAMFDSRGIPASSIGDESWGVVEIGYYTTDFMLMLGGRWVEKASGTCSGARVASEHLHRILGEKGTTVDLFECEEALRTKTIRNYTAKVDVSVEVGEAVNILVSEVVDTATRLMEPYARKLDGVIVAGGGAEFMYDNIKARWPHSVCPEIPRMSVAEGMRRFAAMLGIKEGAGVEA